MKSQALQAVRPLLVCALLGVAAAIGRRDPAPNANYFAFRDPVLENENNNLVDAHSECKHGATVTAIEGWIGNWGSSWHITAIELYLSIPDANGQPKKLVISGGYYKSSELAHQTYTFEAGEYLETYRVQYNGYSGTDRRVASFSFSTNLGKVFHVSTEGMQTSCGNNPCLPITEGEIKAVRTNVDENARWMGSGILCGFYASTFGSAYSGSTVHSGIVDLVPVFYKPISTAGIDAVTFPADWDRQLPALNPVRALTVRVDNRNVNGTSTVTLDVSSSQKKSLAYTYNEGSTIAGARSAKITLSTPEAAVTASTSAETKSDWGMSREAEYTGKQETSKGNTASCEYSVPAGKWAQLVMTEYHGAYQLPYTAKMNLRLTNNNVLRFNTSGTVSGTAISHTSCKYCELDANGCCPSLAPCDATNGRRLASAVDTASTWTEPPQGTHVNSGRRLSSTINDYFRWSQAWAGQNEGSRADHGLAMCTKGLYLAVIEVYYCNTLGWTACGLKLTYSRGIDGEDGETVSIGNTNTGAGARAGPKCRFQPDDRVVRAELYDNGRCHSAVSHKGECRWGKMMFWTKMDGEPHCSLAVEKFESGRKYTVGPAQRENIGSGQLCGLSAAAGTDIDGLRLIFLRQPRSVKVTPDAVPLASLGDTLSSTRTMELDNRPGAMDATLTAGPEVFKETLERSYAETTKNTYGSSTEVTFEASVLGILSTGLSFGSSYSASKAVTSYSSWTEESEVKVTFKSTVKAGEFRCLTLKRYEATKSMLPYNSTRAVTFDNGATMQFRSHGLFNFTTQNTWDFVAGRCPLKLGSKRVTTPTAITLKLDKTMKRDDLLKQMVKAYPTDDLTVDKLRKLNPRLPAVLRKGTKVTLVLRTHNKAIAGGK